MKEVIEMNLQETEEWLNKLPVDLLQALECFFIDDRSKVVTKVIRKKKLKKIDGNNNNQ